MHRLWLDRPLHTYRDFTGTARWLLEYSAETVGSLASHDDADIQAQEIGRKAELVEEVILRRPVDISTPIRVDYGVVVHPTMVTDEELEAIQDVLEEASDYWVCNNYAQNEGSDEEILAGILADQYGPRASPTLTFTFASGPTGKALLSNGIGKGPMWPVWEDVYGPLVAE